MKRSIYFAVAAIVALTACELRDDPDYCPLCAGYDVDAAIRDLLGDGGIGGASGGTGGEIGIDGGQGGTGGEIVVDGGLDGSAGEASSDGGLDGMVDADAEPEAGLDGGPDSMADAATEAGCEAFDACVECVGHGDCPDEACDTGRGVCVPCIADGTGCADNTGDPICKTAGNTDNNECVECTQSSGQCDGATPACDTDSNSCVECLTGTHEGCSGAEPVCKAGATTAENECVQCTAADDDACSDDTPYCDTSDNTCAACLNSSQCTDFDAARCNTLTGLCVSCQSSSPDCDSVSGLPVCKFPEAECVECTAAEDDACTDTTPHCDTDSNSCVACTENSHCLEISAAHCDADSDNTCIGCTEDADCARFVDTPVCDEPAGMCVECTLDTEAAECGAKACRLSDGTCTETDRNSVFPCRECEADSECVSGTYCVDQGGQYCFWDAGAGCADTLGPIRPYSTTSSTLTSIDGYESTFCLPPASVSCAAIVSAETDTICSAFTDCSPSGQGGYCPPASEPREGECSYACEEDYDCKIGLSCPDAGLQYCQ